jgi:hypothetical protein
MKNNKINIINKIATLAVIVSTAFVPLSSFAQGNGNGKKANKVSVNTNTSVVENIPVGPCSALGHYTAPGWIKHNGAITPPVGCVLPPGISKKLGNNTGTSTPPDTTDPVLSFLSTSVGTSTVDVSWVTNEPATSKIYYSTTSPIVKTATTTSVMENTFLVTNRMLHISGLSPNTLYYLIVESTDGSNNTASLNTSVMTSALPIVDVTAPVISAISTSVGSTTLTVGWNTNELATSKIFYSKISPLNKTATTTLFVEELGLTNSHSINILNLATSTTYFFTLESKDSSNNVGTSSEFMVTTSF